MFLPMEINFLFLFTINVQKIKIKNILRNRTTFYVTGIQLYNYLLFY